MEITPKNRNIRQNPWQAFRRSAGTGRQKTVRSPRPAPDGFLRHSFLPKYTQQAPPKEASCAGAFFASLGKVQDEFKLSPIEVQGQPYPYNVLLAMHYTKQQLESLGRDIDLSITQQENGSICLSTRETYDLGSTLYYIPVLPLFQMLKDKRQKRTATLLLSVFTYLYHGAGLPYYRDEDCYLYYQYQYIGTYYRECEDEYEQNEQEKGYSDYTELREAQYYGDIMHRKMYNRYHLNHLEERVDTYIAANDFERGCKSVAKEALSLLEEFPNAKAFRYMEAEGEVDEDDIIVAGQYVSFVAETKGELYDQISQMVNDEFNECGQMEQPTLTKHFDRDYRPCGNSLEFEYRLFALIENLCSLLNNMP